MNGNPFYVAPGNDFSNGLQGLGAIAGQFREEREKKAKAALKAAGLDETHFKHLSNELSGGQIQRVAIARALVNSPSIILADEPTGNLDSRSSHVIMEELSDLHKRGNTIIMVTHEKEYADLTDRVVLLSDGKIFSVIINKK